MLPPAPVESHSSIYFSFSPPPVLSVLREALLTSLSRYSQRIQGGSLQKTESGNVSQFRISGTGMTSLPVQQEKKAMVEDDKPSITVSYNERKLKRKPNKDIQKGDEDSRHLEHTLTLNSPPWKNISLIQRRKSKKINRAQLRYPWKNQRALRQVKPAPVEKPQKKQLGLATEAVSSWGISMHALKSKHQNLLLRKRLNWSQSNPLRKISRQMAYFFS